MVRMSNSQMVESVIEQACEVEGLTWLLITRRANKAPKAGLKTVETQLKNARKALRETREALLKRLNRRSPSTKRVVGSALEHPMLDGM